MKRLLLVTLMVLVTLVGMVGFSRAGNEVSALQATAKATDGAVTELPATVNAGTEYNWTAYYYPNNGTVAEQPFDITYCGSGTMTMVSANKELTQFVYDFKSVAQSKHENKLFDNSNFQAVGVKMIASGKEDEYGFFKLMDPDGDFIAGEVTRAGTEEETWKFLQGTGKWKGIAGGGKSRTTSGGEPTTTTTFEMCNRAIGAFELTK